MYAPYPETYPVSDPSGRGFADRAGWRNRQKRGDKGSAAWFSQWKSQRAATRRVLSPSTKELLARVSCFWRGQDSATCQRLLRPLSITLLPYCVISLFDHYTTSLKPNWTDH